MIQGSIGGTHLFSITDFLALGMQAEYIVEDPVVISPHYTLSNVIELDVFSNFWNKLQQAITEPSRVG